MSKTITSQAQKALINALISQRKKAGLSQVELAEKLRCQQSLVARIESGQRRIEVAELVVICRALGADMYGVLDVVADAVPADEGL